MNRKTANLPIEALVRYFRRVAHDVANPCNALATHLELIAMQTEGRSDVAQVIERARADVDRTIAEAKRALYLPPSSLSGDTSRFSPAGLVDEVWAYLRPPSAQLENDIPAELGWEGPESLVAQALACLLTNAAESGAQRVRCDLSGSRALRISNPVTGDSDPVRWREPFYTTKSERGHLGLGVNMAEHALESAGGALRLEVVDGDCRAEIAL